ncbi:hypothetical protein ABZW30_28475 [Kitasatospora sp. NPDC004669]|uniref:hypothetical protein n=1 Tax=Kitasatospora sp. NPDC004669 TaxID=3154555 RepID=UPI0033AF7013
MEGRSPPSRGDSFTDEGGDLRSRARADPEAIGDAMGLSPEDDRESMRILRSLTARVSASR